MLPRRASRQQQNRNISASDHEQQHHRGKEQVQGSAHGANDPVVQSLHTDPEDVGKILRHVLGELFHEWLQRGVGRGMADARPQEQIDHRGAPRISHQLEWQIDVTATPGESRRRDAHNLKIPVIELQRVAHDVRVGQVMFPPKPVGKNCNRSWLLAVHRVGWPKSASKQRRHAEILKTIRDEAHGVHVLRKILPGQHQSAGSPIARTLSTTGDCRKV